MTKNIVLEDFLRLALGLREAVATHKVPAKLRASLIEDVVFQFASFLDQRQGTNFHESIDGLLDEHAEALAQVPKPASVLVAQLEVVFGRGRKKEMNILSTDLRNDQALRETVEFSLGLRSLEELDARIDSQARFTRLLEKKDGLRTVRFNAAANIDTPSWIEVPLGESSHGTLEPSLESVCQCILRVAGQWM